MSKINIDGIDIYYEVHGEGEPLMLLHHGTGCTRIWDNLLSGFTDRFKTILYDRRGFGRSDNGDNFRAYYRSKEYNRNSVREMSLLLEHLNIKGKLYIVGQCEGGVVGFHYARQNPEKVAAIAVSSTMCSGILYKSNPSKGTSFTSFNDLDMDFQKKLIEWHGESWVPEFFSLFLQQGGAYGTNIEAFDLSLILGDVRCPALVLYPDRSSLFNVEQGVLMYRSLPGGELAVLPHCGHNTYEQQPEEYQKIILSFFERHGQQSLV